MEIKIAGQGGQANLEVNKGAEKTVQPDNNKSSDRAKADDNKTIGNKDISEKKLKDAVDKLNKFLEDNNTHAEYEYHDKFKNDLMIRIVDNNSGEVIQEVPPKRVLDMVAKMLEMVGVLFDKKA